MHHGYAKRRFNRTAEHRKAMFANLAQALINSANHEENPGVRLTAIDALVNHAVQAKDGTLVPELQRLAGNDSNRYVRLTCAKAVHDLVGDGD